MAYDNVLDSSEKTEEELDFNRVLYEQINALAKHASTIFLEPPYTSKLKTFKAGTDILETLLIGYQDDRYRAEMKGISKALEDINPQMRGDEFEYFEAVREKLASLMNLMLRLAFLPPKKIKTRLDKKVEKGAKVRL